MFTDIWNLQAFYSLQIEQYALWSRGQTDIYGLFCELVAPPPPQEEKLGYYFELGTCLGALETHVLLSFLWSAFCKWPVINVTLLTLKIVVLKKQD